MEVRALGARKKCRRLVMLRNWIVFTAEGPPCTGRPAPFEPRIAAKRRLQVLYLSSGRSQNKIIFTEGQAPRRQLMAATGDHSAA